MLLWLIVVAIFAVLALTGYYKGAIRSLVALVGLIVAIYLALPLSPLIKPLVPKVGLVHPIWPVILPPVVVFLLIALLFIGLSFLVHHKVAMHFKYAADDYTRLRWERLNQRLGLGVGLIGGAIYSILVGLVIYILGYPVVQVTGDDSPALQKFLSSTRQDVSSSGLDKTLASIDPVPNTYYQASDVLGLVYQNYAALQQRMANYPAFLGYGERQEFKDIASDTTLLNLLQTRGPLIEVLKHPKIVALLNNAEIMGEFQQLSLKDLYQYLKTGKSAKFDEEKLLGWWQLDPHATFTLARKRNPDMPAKQMAALKQMLMVWIPLLKVMAAPDNTVMLRLDMSPQAQQFIEQARRAVEAAQQAAQAAQGAPSMSQLPPGYAERYGLNRRPQPAPDAPPPTPAAAAPLPGVPQLDVAAKGTWQREGSSSRYTLKLQSEQGRSKDAAALVQGDELVITSDGMSMVFVRTY
jgi:uncharacterized membrane protein required for colicin V production